MNHIHWLKQRRETLGITQQQLAQRLSAGGMPITKAAISKWELGRTPLPLQTPDNRHLIASVLELSISELLVLAGYEIEDEWSQNARLVATLFDSLLHQDRETILLLVHHLKAQNDEMIASVSDNYEQR